MDWQVNREEHEEFCQEPLVEALHRHLTERRDRAVKALRSAARQGNLTGCSRAEQEIADFELFLSYLTIQEDGEEITVP